MRKESAESIKARIVEHYIKEADVYDFLRYEDPTRPMNLRVRRKVEETLSKYLVGQTVFELACGTGYWGKYIKRLGCQYVGVDITPAFKEKAANYGLDIIIGDVEDISSYPTSVDNIVCVKAFTMFPNPQVVLENVYRTLRPGGRLLVFYNNKFNILGSIHFLFTERKRKRLGLRDTYDIHPSTRTFLSWLHQAGLKEILTGTCCNIPYRFLPKWNGLLDWIDDRLGFGWITYIVAEKTKKGQETKR